jgi:WD40 repeat protein/uncharacterized caspase-like protein
MIPLRGHVRVMLRRGFWKWTGLGLGLAALLPLGRGLAQENLKRPDLVLRSGQAIFSTYAVSPNGEWYAAYGQHRLGIFSAADGMQYRTIAIGENEGGPQSVAVLGNGTEILVPGRTLADGHARVLRFRVDDAKRLPDLVLAEKGLATRVACDRKDDLVAVYVANQGVPIAETGPRILHVSTGALVFKAPAVANAFAELTLSDDGMRLVVSAANRVELFDRRAGAVGDGRSLVLDLRPDSARVLRFSPSGKYVAVMQTPNLYGSSSGTCLRLFQTETGDAMPAVSEDVFAMDFPDDENVLISRPHDFAIVNVKTGKVTPSWPGKKELVQGVFVTPGRRTALLASLTGVEVVGYPSGETVPGAAKPVELPFEYAFRPDDSGLLTRGEWDLRTGEYEGGSTDIVQKLAVSSDSRYVARIGTGALRVSARGGTTRELPAGENGQWYSVTFSPDSKLLAAGWAPSVMQTHTDEIRLYTLPGLEPAGSVKLKVEAMKFVDSFVFSPDGRWAAASVAGTISIYKVSGAKFMPLKTFPLPHEMHLAPQADGSRKEQEADEPYGRQAQLVFSPDGKHLAVQGDFLHIFSTSTWTEEFPPQKASAGCVLFSPDSGRVLTLLGQDETTMTLDDMDRPARFAAIDLQSHKVVAEDATSRIQCPAALDGRGKLLASRVPDGLALYSATDFSLQGTMYEFPGDDWLFAAPDGLFDGTPGAWDYLNWRFSEKTFELEPVELFFREFYRPGLVAEVFAGKEEKAPADIESLDRRQPTVKLGVHGDGSARLVKVRVEVAESREKVSEGSVPPGSGVRDVRLFHNGVLVKVWRGELPLDAAGVGHVETQLPIVAGDNEFIAYAFNDADVKSRDSVTRLTGTAALARKGIAYVVAIGINRYAAETATKHVNLSFSEADAIDFARTFEAAQKTTGEFSEVRVITLLSEQATRANIQAVFTLLAGGSATNLSDEQKALLKGAEGVKPEDGVFVFYAGHGFASPDHFYLLPTDVRFDRNSFDPESRTLSDEALEDMFDGISPDRAFLVLDACHSGRALEADGMSGGPMNSRGLAQLAYDKGIDVLTASEAVEVALEAPELAGGHGYLTYALVEEGLKKREAAAEGRVELRGWFRFASRRVPELQAGPRAGQPDAQEVTQHPRMFYRREPESQPFVVAPGAMPTTN